MVRDCIDETVDVELDASLNVYTAIPTTGAPAEAAAEEESGLGPRCSPEHVLNCQFSRWYPLFKHCTPKSVVLDLTEDVVQYLQQDGVVLPKGFEMSCGDGLENDSDNEVDWNEDNEEEDGDDRVR